MKIIIKIFNTSESIFNKKGKFFTVAKDKDDNYFMFNSNIRYNKDQYYLIDILEYDYVISQVATINIEKYKLYKLNINNGILYYKDKPIKSEEVVIKRVSIKKLVTINKKLDFFQKLKRVS